MLDYLLYYTNNCKHAQHSIKVNYHATMLNKNYVLFFTQSLGLPSRFATTHTDLKGAEVRGTREPETVCGTSTRPRTTLCPVCQTPECTLVRSDLHKLKQTM